MENQEATFKEYYKLINDYDDKLFDSEPIDEDVLCEFVEKLKEWGCKAKGSHDWAFDQCCYWQHQYCINCGEAKYPELASKSCGDITSEMGNLTEDSYQIQL